MLCPFSVVYSNSFTVVGKKLILLLACSIRIVNKGVCGSEGEAPTHAVTANVAPTITAARINHFCTLSIKSPPFFL